MRLGGTTFSFMWEETASETMRRIGKLGLREFDVILAPGHLWPDEMDVGARTRMRRELSEEGLKIESLNLPALDFNLGSCLSEVRAYGVQQFTEALQLSGELGGRGVVVVPGRVSGLLPPRLQDTTAWLGESIEALARVADSLGQDLLLETHPLTAFPSAEALASFIEKIAHPRLLVAYDVANAEFIGEDQVGALRHLASILGQVHISDATRTSWKHDRAGLGTVDFPAVRETLEALGFDGLVVVEVISPDTIADTEATVRAWNN